MVGPMANTSDISTTVLSDTSWHFWNSWNGLDVVFVISVIVLTLVASKLVDRLIHHQFEMASRRMDVDETAYRIIRHTSVALVYVFGLVLIIMRFPTLQNLSFAIFAGAGFLGIVVGLAAQSTMSNIISGVSLAIFRPFRVGDRVNVRDDYGKITDITLRHTIVKTWDNRRLIIPNHVISDEAIINWTIEDPTVCWPIDIGISYDSDIDLARKIMVEEGRKHNKTMSFSELRQYDEKFSDDDILVLLTELGDFAVNLKLFVWVRDRSFAYLTGCEIREAIKKRFDQEGIEIPFPYRTLVYKKDLIAEQSNSYFGQKED
ncbi:mechanosensitive ion channel family protein [Methanohalophilus sp. RSK]|uniref:mechanosensitive ion channel family protein n=1 Tax=Methanohalophilus sp. RSK TaxID=2485783 RepID=UPI001F487E1B|nr:mechanosensitive ion channel family protein [Methanohalophilus sp. RSK]